MMQEYSHLRDVKTKDTCIKHKKLYSNVIYSLDIETTSMFFLNNRWSTFIYDDNIDYKDVPKAAVPYIWMFGVNDNVYYGREFYNLKDVLLKLSDPLLCKIIWVFNLSFEFAFLMDILKDYTIEKMVAREKRKPISFFVKELNIEFRCAYMLTNMKLADAAKFYTHVQKMEGDLDYNQLRSPLTKLDDTEMMYCEMDIVSLYEIILTFMDKYGSLARIPLTSTSTVRYAIRQVLDIWYIREMQAMVPPVDMYLKFWYAFAGGYTHANIVKCSQVILSAIGGLIYCFDEASAYPAALCTEKYPCRPFVLCDTDKYYDKKYRENHCFIFRVKMYKVKAVFYNHYIQYDKVKETIVNPVTDNGRIVKCDYAELWCTDIDLDIILCNYKGKFVIDKNECYSSFKKYLDIRIIQFILEMYKNKTELKDIVPPDNEMYEYYNNLYKSSKALLNGIYGMAVTSILHMAEFYDNDWKLPKELDPDLKQNIGINPDKMLENFVNHKLDDARKSFSTLFYYPTGIFCTAYCRRNIFMRLISSHEFDMASLYCDTDSIFFQGKKWFSIFDDYNKQMYNKYVEVTKYYPDIKIEDFMPIDPKGKAHPIGYFELDKVATEFVTHGAKKYCYRGEKDGELHLTVSGVAKSGVSALKDDITNFKKDFVWGYSESGKLIHSYFENQPDITFTDKDGNTYTSHQRNGIVLQPTSYTLGMTPIYEALVRRFELGFARRFER